MITVRSDFIPHARWRGRGGGWRGGGPLCKHRWSGNCNTDRISEHTGFSTPMVNVVLLLLVCGFSKAAAFAPVVVARRGTDAPMPAVAVTSRRAVAARDNTGEDGAALVPSKESDDVTTGETRAHRGRGRGGRQLGR